MWWIERRTYDHLHVDREREVVRVKRKREERGGGDNCGVRSDREKDRKRGVETFGSGVGSNWRCLRTESVVSETRFGMGNGDIEETHVHIGPKHTILPTTS